MRYTLQKLTTMLITLVTISFLVFLSFHLIAGDPATKMLGTEATPERLAALRTEMGLDAPFLVRYVRWFTAFITGDFGSSYSYNMPVSAMIGDKVPITLTLTFMAFLLIILLSIPLGVYTAKKANRLIDRIIMVVNQIIMAVPPFFAGIILTLVFGLILRLFTPGGYVSYKTDSLKFITYLFFPALALALPKAAMAIKLLRSSVLAEARLDYVRTAYSKGNSTNQVLYRHVLKNAMIPFITFLGMTLAEMIAGSIIIEQVFGIPGLGRILLTSIANRDYPVVMAIIILIAFMVLVVNIVVDIIYGLIDPRIKQRDFLSLRSLERKQRKSKASFGKNVEKMPFFRTVKRLR
ncbi:MAG: ABC transporter permease [Lachnospiraceae bacterium]|nr:ABC transporter permease [Lachnospiraceae bacterium]